MPDPREVGFVDLVWLLEMTHDEYLERFRGTAVRRAKHWMLQRNAAVALGNTGGPDHIEPLVRALRTNDHPIVRGHAAWALGQIGRRHGLAAIRESLQSRLRLEQDPEVRQEVELAIQDLDGAPPGA